MITFEKYFEYIKNSFSRERDIVVGIKNKSDSTLIISINANSAKKQGIGGYLYIKFDQQTVEFFGDFMPDDCIDWDENFWKKYTEKEILSFLDKKIAEYKYYITNGYFFVFYNKKGDMVNCISYTLDEDFKNFDYEKMYSKEKFSSDADFNDCKSVTVTNFYGEIVVDNKVLN